MTNISAVDREATQLAVATHDLSIRYGKSTVLHNLELSVPDGAVYVLVGENGAGKSTTMKALLNLETPASGRAEVFGLDTVAEGAKVRAQIGYVPDYHEHSYNWMTAAQLMRHVSVHYPTWDRAYAEHLCEAFAVLLQRKVGTLSKGEMRRLQFVFALAHRPPLLLLDEPTDGLDPVVRNRTLATLAEHLSDTPTTVLISTHHIHEVESLADQVGVLREGRLIAQMSIEELQRTVRRYRVEIAEGWQVPPELQLVSGRRSSSGREAQYTLVGDQREVLARFSSAGATVRDVKPLTLEEAALAFLSGEVATWS